MRKIFFATMICILAAYAHAEDWIQMSVNDQTEYFAKPGSFVVTKNAAGSEILVITAKFVNKQTNDVTPQKMYVSKMDCAAEQGKIVTLNIAGKFQFENEFVFGAGNLASVNAEFICGIAKYNAEQARNKSLK